MISEGQYSLTRLVSEWSWCVPGWTQLLLSLRVSYAHIIFHLLTQTYKATTESKISNRNFSEDQEFPSFFLEPRELTSKKIENSTGAQANNPPPMVGPETGKSPCSLFLCLPGPNIAEHNRMPLALGSQTHHIPHAWPWDLMMDWARPLVIIPLGPVFTTCWIPPARRTFGECLSPIRVSTTTMTVWDGT